MVKLDRKIKEKLFLEAIRVRENAYAPYSNYKVGSALLTDTGEIFSGCNVENASFGLTVCAERNAIANAVVEGKKKFIAILVLTQDEEPGTPCGACRQVISEFFNPDAVVLLANTSGIKKEILVSELLPQPFKFKKSL